jgi:hypothetical protein
MSRRIAVVVALLVLGLGAACVWNQVRTRHGEAVRFMPYVAAARSDADVARGRQRIYHRRNCPHAAKIAPDRQVGWRCEWAATWAGYRPCRSCSRRSTP